MEFGELAAVSEAGDVGILVEGTGTVELGHRLAERHWQAEAREEPRERLCEETEHCDPSSLLHT